MDAASERHKERDRGKKKSISDSRAPPDFAMHASSSSSKRQKSRNEIVKGYNDKLAIVTLGAQFATALHSLNWLLGFCALTWASVVILGGYVEDLSKRDFYSVSALLLLEAIRLAAAMLFGNIVTRKLVQGTYDPSKIKYDDFKRQVLVEVLRSIDQIIQLMVIAMSVVLPLRRLQDLGGPSKGNVFNGVHDSLYIFYVLVLVNAIFATIAVIHAKTITRFYVTTYDLRKFYDKMVWSGMDKGLLYAADFDFLTFAMKTQADEYGRQLRAPVVHFLYKDLIDYLYYHNKGFEVVCFTLETGDIYEREAAANIVGLWATAQLLRNDAEKLQTEHNCKKPHSKNDAEKPQLENASEKQPQSENDSGKVQSEIDAEKRQTEKDSGKPQLEFDVKKPQTVNDSEKPQPENDSKRIDAEMPQSEIDSERPHSEEYPKMPVLRLQNRLLSKLAGALDNDETGRAASTSFQHLAKLDAEGLLGVKSESDKPLMDILINCLKQVVEAGRHDRVLVYTKALIELLKNTTCRGAMTEDQLTLLEVNLENVFKDKRCLKRTKAIAGHALRLITDDNNPNPNVRKRNLKPTEQDVTYCLRLPRLRDNEYILKDENEFLLELIGRDYKPDWKIDVRDTKPSRVTPFFARPAISFIAALVNLCLTVCASYLIHKYASF